MKNIIIFDFDGVISDSVKVVYDMNKEAVEAIGKELSMEQYLSCFEGHINQRLQKFLNLSDEEKGVLVAHKARLFPKYYTPENVKLFDFAEKLVVEASKLGELWIVSSCPGDLIKNLLDSYSLTKYFTNINGQNTRPKNEVFKSAFENNKGSKVFFITDTTGDIKETRNLDFKMLNIAVTWGFHSAELLKSENPDLLTSNPDEIIDFISKNI
jgi:phosphoglycolate phosphatase-like HAD superfamily hydrolase